METYSSSALHSYVLIQQLFLMTWEISFLVELTDLDHDHLDCHLSFAPLSICISYQGEHALS